ncbi:MAG: ATP-binding protein [Flavobacteriales bacterium]|nr:ATP-binding protein [Flavobacteriales bacterium]
MRGVMRVVITGPESSGKTSLAEGLADHYGTAVVREMARPYLESKVGKGTARVYVEEDLLHIARLQLEEEERTVDSIDPDQGLMVCDTDLITIRIWGQEKFGRSDPWIVRRIEQRQYDLWLLCAPDMPWEPDPLRENPHDRDRLFAVYEHTWEELGMPYVIMLGVHEVRMQQAIRAIERTRTSRSGA